MILNVKEIHSFVDSVVSKENSAAFDVNALMDKVKAEMSNILQSIKNVQTSSDSVADKTKNSYDELVSILSSREG